MKILKVNLPDIREIDTWDEFDRYIEIYFPDENGLKKLKEYEIISLYQNSCDGRNYRLRDIPIEHAIDAWEQAYKD